MENADQLKEYRDKRHFDRTSEPQGKAQKAVMRVARPIHVS